MAQIRHPLFVSITGKIDNMVFYRRNGKVFLRRLPVTKKRKPSESQLSHRRQFTAVIAFYRVVKSTFLLQVWRAAVENTLMNSCCLFVKHNCRAFDDNGKLTDYTCLRFSVGPLARPYCLKCRWLKEENAVRLTWKNNVRVGKQKTDDQLVTVIVYENDEFTVYPPQQTGAVRRDGTVTLLLPPDSSVPCAAYCFFAGVSSGFYSKDCYCRIRTD